MNPNFKKADGTFLELDESPLASVFKKLDHFKHQYNDTVIKRNQYSEVLTKLDKHNQLDKAIIDFQRSVGAYGISTAEWKLFMIKGLDGRISELESRLEALLKLIQETLNNEPE